MNINNICVLLYILFWLLIGSTLFVVSIINFFAENRKSNRSYIKIFGWSVMIFITALQIIWIIIYIVGSLLPKQSILHFKLTGCELYDVTKYKQELHIQRGHERKGKLNQQKSSGTRYYYARNAQGARAVTVRWTKSHRPKPIEQRSMQTAVQQTTILN